MNTDNANFLAFNKSIADEFAKCHSYALRNTHELKVGDVVNCHGSLFELIERASAPSELPSDANGDNGGDCVWFTTEYLGHDGAKGDETIPPSWRKDWTVQGNRRATWSVLVRGNVTLA